jgi:hypothetical protein
MTDYEWLQFKDTGYNLTHLPQSTHLTIQTTLYLYYVSADNNKELWKYTIATGSDELITTRTEKIRAIWPDRTNGILWIVDCDDHAANNTFYVWSLTISDDTISSIDSQALTWCNVQDIFIYSGTVYVITQNYDSVAEDSFFKVWDVDASPFVEIKSHTITTSPPEFDCIPHIGFLKGDKFYWGTDNSNYDRSLILYYDIGANGFIASAAFNNYSATSDVNQRVITYDNDADLIYIVLNKDADSENYFISYDVSGDSWTEKTLYDIALMSDRNCAGTEDTPYEFEKGFHISSSYIYQIHKSYKYLVKVQDLELASGVTIKAITDKYLITSPKDVYEYANTLDKSPKAEGIFAINKLPRMKFEYKSPLSTDQLIEIWEDRVKLIIRNKVGIPKFSNKKKIYKFKLENLGREDLTREIDDVAAAEDIATTAINQINDNSKYLYTDATATPAIGVNNTNIWDDLKLKDNLYTLRILGNAFWYMDANGRVWFRKWANKVVQAQHYFNKPDYFKKGTIGAITSAADLDWINTLNLDASCTAALIAELDNHKNVLELDDQNAAGNAEVIHSFGVAQADRVFEFYWAKDNIGADKRFRFMMYEGATQIVSVYMHTDDIFYWDGAQKTVKLNCIVASEFIHIKVVLDDSANTYDIYVDKTLEVDNAAMPNNSTTGATDCRFSTYFDQTGYKCYLDAPGNIADSEYSVGDNLKGAFHKTGDVGAPSPKRVQEQFNTWKIYAGWDVSSNKPFEKELTDAEHIQQYGPLKWKGRDLFTEARSQAACDAIATALNNWKGMQDNPDDVIISLYGYEFVGVGKQFTYTWDFYLGDTYLLSTTTDYIISKNRINFITGEQRITLSTNIVSRGAAI